MKIYLFTDTFYDKNGTSTFIEDIALLSLKKHIDIKIFFSNNNTPSDIYKNVNKMKRLLKLPMPFYPQFTLVFPNYFNIKRILKENKPDIIHISTPGPIGICAKKAAKRLAIPIVGTYHTNHPSYIYENTNSIILETMAKKYLENFYKDFIYIFTRSKQNKTTMINDIKIDAKKIKKIPIGVNLDKFNLDKKYENLLNKFNITEKIKFLYVGRLTDDKNVKFLIDTWNELLKEKDLDAALVFVGEGKYKNTPIKNGYYIGEVPKDELVNIYYDCDVFLFPSITDTLGQVVIEAQICGLSTIVSNIGGPKEIIKKIPKSGIVKEINKNKWKKAILKLYEKENLRIKYSQAAKKKASFYNFSKSFNYFIKIHKKAIKINNFKYL